MEQNIDWQYFFGGCGGRSYDRYYKADFNGVHCEKHNSDRGTLYAIGNIDKAKTKFKTESELIKAIKTKNNGTEQGRGTDETEI